MIIVCGYISDDGMKRDYLATVCRLLEKSDRDDLAIFG